MARSLGEAVLTITAKTKNSIRGIQNFGKNLHHIGSSVSAVGSKMRNFGLVGVTALGAIITPAVAFEKAMSRVKALVGDKSTAKEMKMLTDEAKRLGATSIFTASQVADAQGFLAMARLNAKEIKTSLAPTLALAQAGNIGLARAADLATNVMSGFGKKTKDLGHIIDVMAVGAANSNTSVEEMAMAMKVIAPFASKTKTGIEEVSAAIGILANSGLKGSEAGTGLQRIMVRLTKPTKEVNKALADAGVKYKEVNPSTKSLVQIMERLHKANLLNAESAAVFGLRGLKFGVSLGSKEATTSLRALKAQMQNADGAAQKMADTMADNVWGTLMGIKSALEAISLEIFDALGTSVRDSLKDVLKYVRSWVTWVKNNQQLVKALFKLLGIIAIFSVVIGTALSILGTVIIAMGGLVTIIGTTLSVLSAGIVPILAFVAVFATMAVAIGILIASMWKYRKTIIKTLADAGALKLAEALWKGLKVVVEDTVESVKKYMALGKKAFLDFLQQPKVKAFIAQIKQIAKQIQNLGMKAIKWIQKTAKSVKAIADKEIPKMMGAFKEWVLPIVEQATKTFSYFSAELDQIKWGSIVQGIKDMVIPTIDLLKAAFSILSDILQGYFINILNYWEGLVAGFMYAMEDLGPLWDELVQAWRELVIVFEDAFGESDKEMWNWGETLKTVGIAVGYIIGSLVKLIIWAIKTGMEVLKFAIIFVQEWGKQAVDIFFWIYQAIEDILIFIRLIPTRIKRFVEEFFGLISDLWTMVKTLFNEAIATIEFWIWKVWKAVKDWFVKLINEAGKAIMNFINAIKAPFIIAYNWIKGKINALIAWIDNRRAKFRAAGAKIVNSLWQGMKEVWANMKAWWGKAWADFKGFLNWKKKNSPSMKEIWEGSMKGLISVANKGANAIKSEVSGVHLTAPQTARQGSGLSSTLTDNRKLEMNVNSSMDLQEVKRQIGNHFQNRTSFAGNV